MSRSDTAAAVRALGEYRRLVLLGNLRLPLAQARRLLGPDCAYHLYFRHAARNVAPSTRAAAAKRARSRRSRSRRRRDGP
jgi:hypothetical protein